jgi:hypothetical protein
MNIIILGNGFDLAHQLKTRYSDFVQFCRNFLNGKAKIDDSILSNKFLSIINDNIWFKFFDELSLNESERSKSWIDFENIIFSILQLFSFDDNFSVCHQFTKNDLHNNEPKAVFMNVLLTKCKNYLNDLGIYSYGSNDFIVNNVKKVALPLYTQLQLFTRALQIYFISLNSENHDNQLFYNLNLPLLQNKFNIKILKTYIISFNYTDTFIKYYSEQISRISKLVYMFIHGKASDIWPNNYDKPIKNLENLVLGTNSFDEYNLDSKIPKEFNIFQKHNQRHLYQYMNDYQELLCLLKNSYSRHDNRKRFIYIIGHSLNKSDHNMLKEIFLANNSANITVFYHNDCSKINLINNITEILGEIDVNSRVKFEYQHNKKTGFLIPNSE